MAQNSEVNVPVDLDELCNKIKRGSKASLDEIKSMLIMMDENQFKSCFLKLIRPAMEVKRSDAVEFVISKMEGSLPKWPDKGWGMFFRPYYSAYMVTEEILRAATDQELIIRLFEISIKNHKTGVAKFLLDKIFALLHHAIWGDIER